MTLKFSRYRVDASPGMAQSRFIAWLNDPQARKPGPRPSRH